LSLGQFARLPGVSERLYIFDLFAAFYALISLYSLFVNYKELRTNVVAFGFIAFSLWAFLSLTRSILLYNYPGVLFQAFYLFRWVIYLIAALGVVHFINKKYFDFVWLLKLIMFLGLFLTLVGFVQLIVLPDFTVLDSSYGWDPHKNRLASTFYDPNFVGAFLVSSIAIYLGLVYMGYYRPLKQKLELFMFFFIPLLGLFFTFSRSAWGMFALVVLIFGILRYRLLLIVFLLISFLVYFAVPRVQTRLSGIADPADSAHFRLISWENALKVFNTSPTYGVGLNSYRYAQQDLGLFSIGDTGGNSGAGADSSWLFILATTGWAGTTIFSTTYFVAIYKSFIYRKQGGIIAFVILITLFFESVFINSVFYPQILILWLVLALLTLDEKSAISSRFDT
jgi:O-antigen ligase